MPQRVGKTVRLFIVLLLLLGISPVTAPFLTCDLVALLSDRPSDATLFVQAKEAKDEPAAASSNRSHVIVASRPESMVPTALAGRTATRATLPIPLRI